MYYVEEFVTFVVVLVLLVVCCTDSVTSEFVSAVVEVVGSSCEGTANDVSRATRIDC